MMITIDNDIDWLKILDNAGKQAIEQFGRPDVVTEDAQRAWNQLASGNKLVEINTDSNSTEKE